MKTFPVHPSDRQILASIPWHIIEPHEAQARRNHGQTLERLAERAGLGLIEMRAVLSDLDYSAVPKATDAEHAGWIREFVRATESKHQSIEDLREEGVHQVDIKVLTGSITLESGDVLLLPKGTFTVNLTTMEALVEYNRKA
jgi:hypothetical protein